MHDDEILKLVRQGDEKVIEVLYKKHFRMMAKLVIQNNGSEDEAKDVFQDALVAFWQNASKPEFALTSKISTYLYSICLNLWRKELDRKKRLSNEQVDRIDEVESDNEEKLKTIQKCIDKLGETCKKVLTLYYFDGLGMNDIAERLNFSNADTAKTKKYKCKKELDQLVKKEYKEKDFYN